MPPRQAAGGGRVIVPIGKPISNVREYLNFSLVGSWEYNINVRYFAGLQTEFFVVAEGQGQHPKMVQVARGEEGELCIGGMGVALGYLHAPDLTAQVRIQ